MLKSNIKLLVIAITSLLSTSTFTADKLNTYSTGKHNDARVFQTGGELLLNVVQFNLDNDANESYVDHNGTRNVAEIIQSAEGNRADFTKSGNDNDSNDQRIGNYQLALLGVLGMSNNSEAKTAGAHLLKAWINVEQKNGFLHITPTIEWLLTVTASEANKFSYHLSVIKDGVGGHNSTSQKGGIPLNPLNQHVSLSSTQVNYSSEDNYKFSLKIYRNDQLIASTSKSW
ncbi:MAG: curli-like amyloid fiber formation chaperone CsgH [Methylococcales bacterium]